MGVRYVGAAVKRAEDPNLVTGNGRYVDGSRKSDGLRPRCAPT